MKFSGNTVLITGGSSGIGYAMAEAFLDAGSTVVICARGERRLTEAQHTHPNLHTRICDVADSEARQALGAFMADRFPQLNIFVNNAGVQRDIDLTHGVEEFLAGDNEIRVNLEAPIILSALLIPLLARNPQPAIINVSSGLGFVPMANMPVYCASKAGMHAFCMTMRVQLDKLGMKVFEVVPPMVDTALNPVGRAKRGGFEAGLGPQEFVAAVMRGLENDVPEIGYGMTAGYSQASRADLDRRFAEMNARF
jgi:uncharacterized oxidoreductase